MEASWNSEGEGVSWTGILRAWGVTQFGIQNTQGSFIFEFPEVEDSKSST